MGATFLSSLWAQTIPEGGEAVLHEAREEHADFAQSKRQGRRVMGGGRVEQERRGSPQDPQLEKLCHAYQPLAEGAAPPIMLFLFWDGKTSSIQSLTKAHG